MDLLNTLGKKETKTSANGTDNSAPSTGTGKTETIESKSETAATVQKTGTGVENTSDQSGTGKVEPIGTDPNTWTTESALKEVKRLREENKHTRLKYEDSVQSLKAEMEARFAAKEKQLEELKSASKELDEIREKEADKKRDLAEKVAHREAQAAELKAKLEATERRYQEELNSLKTVVSQYNADREAQNAVQQKRLNEELATIPEKYKDVANLLVKGAGGPADALLAISEAKIKGLFEDKTIVVNHSVPGAHDGARTNKERLDAADKDQRAKMTAQQKIGQALKDMKQQPNTAFRTK